MAVRVLARRAGRSIHPAFRRGGREAAFAPRFGAADGKEHSPRVSARRAGSSIRPAFRRGGRLCEVGLILVQKAPLTYKGSL